MKLGLQLSLLLAVLLAGACGWPVAGTSGTLPPGARPQAAAPTVRVVADGLVGPIGMAALPGGGLLVAEQGTGERDDSAGISLLLPGGVLGRYLSGLPSSRDSGDLAGAPLIGLSPDGATLYIGHFGQGHLWTRTLSAKERSGGLELPAVPLTQTDLTPAMRRLNNVFLVNPFDIVFDRDGAPVVTDASGNGVAKETAEGTVRFFHRFDQLANPVAPSDPIEAVPTGMARVGDEYYVALTGGCPFPPGAGKIVAIDEERNQRTVAEGLNMPIDVAAGPDGAIWVLEFAAFAPDAGCFSGSGYQAKSGRLSRLRADGALETVLDGLDFPGAVLPMADGSLYISEVFPGRILHVTFDGTVDGTVDGEEALPGAD